ncbi:hypothetical protein FLP41_04815 [Paracoccus marcusii]|nr:hypothetical protein FLP41_04815 [Paracoccus marcusii]
MAAHDRAKQERRHSLLDGVAISWKDNIDSGGTVTEAGSRLLEGACRARTPTSWRARPVAAWSAWARPT